MIPEFAENQQLTPHFSLYELTITNNAALQKENRILDSQQILKIKSLAQFGEGIRHLCGDLPMRVHSGYRCAAVNGATIGSSNTSQHPLCEAIDFDIYRQSTDQTFGLLLKAAKNGKFCFGQLIIEAAKRDYGVTQWVHCSMIGTLDKSKVGQAMRAFACIDGKFAYSLVDKIDFVSTQPPS